MGLNKEEEEILKQIELELSKEDPDLAKTVETSTLSSFSRTRSVLSFATFVIGLLTMLGSYILQPLIAIAGFALMAMSGYVFVRNTKALLRAENINEWNFKQVYRTIICPILRFLEIWPQLQFEFPSAHEEKGPGAGLNRLALQGRPLARHSGLRPGQSQGKCL